jgi:hypothetical protein
VPWPCSIAVSQKTAVGVALGLSLTINEIHNTTRAIVETRTSTPTAPFAVTAESDARIDSLAFGIAVAVAISGNATAIGVGATGALSFNDIDNIVEATVANTANGTATVLGRRIRSGERLPRHSDARSPSWSPRATTRPSSPPRSPPRQPSRAAPARRPCRSRSAGAGPQPHREDRLREHRQPAERRVPRDILVSSHDGASIHVTTVAAAVAIAISGGGTSIGVAGGAAESTNVILTHTIASIENSEIDARGPPLGKVEVLADSTSDIKAVVAGVAVSIAIGNTGVGVAVGIAVARNFIGYDPDSTGVSYNKLSTEYVATLTPGLRVKIAPNPTTAPGSTTRVAPGTPMDGDIFEYVGATALPRYDYTNAEKHAKIQAGRRSGSGRPSMSTSARTSWAASRRTSAMTWT